MLVERVIPAGTLYKANGKRRTPRTASSAPRGTRSLDSFNHLATSDSETYEQWKKRHETAQDRRRKTFRIWESLLESLKSAGHTEAYIRERAAVEGATTDKTAWQRAAKGGGRKAWSALKDYERVAACQTQWKGYRTSCCDGRAVAVPIGCNHRLCPLCNAHRAEHYRDRVRQLFDVIPNPQLLTLTVPNPKHLTRQTFVVLRKRLRAFLKENKDFIKGGVYSLEITRNKKESNWHPHFHALVDVAGPVGQLPYWAFMERKWWLEFSWFVLTQGARRGQRVWNEYDFAEWVAPLDPRQHGLPMTPRNVERLAGKRFGERRSVDIRPVSTDKKAAYEVMKYMTKVAFFVDDPKAIAEFLTAVKGVRAIQTFGSCYGFKLDEKPVKSTLPDCSCGQNKWEDIGTLGLGMVYLSPEGRWWVRDDAPVHGRRCRGGTTKAEAKC